MPEISANCSEPTPGMETDARNPKRQAPRTSHGTRLFASMAFYLVFALFVQWHAHAPSAGFGTFPDEPSHYVGGLLIRDYAVSGLPQTPLAFAENYRQNLPYFAIGHGPPLF
jgi:hypothetical protein